MMSRSMNFIVRLAGPEDRLAIVDAVAELLPGVDVARRHRWLYEENPHGPALTWIARDGATGHVAGMTSFFPRCIVAQGREGDGRRWAATAMCARRSGAAGSPPRCMAHRAGTCPASGSR